MLQNGMLASNGMLQNGTHKWKSVSYKANIHYLENKIMKPVINEIVLKPFRTAGLVMSEKEKQYHKHMLK